MIGIIDEDLEVGKCDYFMSFIKDVIRDLKKTGNSYVFNQEQVDYIKQIYNNIIIDYKDDIFYLTLNKR